MVLVKTTHKKLRYDTLQSRHTKNVQEDEGMQHNNLYFLSQHFYPKSDVTNRLCVWSDPIIPRFLWCCVVRCYSINQFTLQFYTPVFKTGRIIVYQCPSVRPFHMSRSNIRTPWPIHFKFHRVIGIDGLTVCILYGEISNFHSRVMGLYSSNCT